jgi:hypothetical protein
MTLVSRSYDSGFVVGGMVAVSKEVGMAICPDLW